MKLKQWPIALALFLPLIGAWAKPLDHGDLVTLSTRPGVTQSMFIESPSDNPPAVIVLYSGDDGAIRLDTTGATAYRGNFLIRTARFWVAHGDAAVLVDMPSDHADGAEDSFRRSAESLIDQQAIVAELHKRFAHSKIVLVGTSRGTSSVGNVITRDPGLADAYVLTSPVTIMTRKGFGVSDLKVPDAVRARVLVVSNDHDQCGTAMYYGAKDLAKRDALTFITEDSNQGGRSREAECTGNSPHGFRGVERQTLEDINQWIKQTLTTVIDAH